MRIIQSYLQVFNCTYMSRPRWSSAMKKKLKKSLERGITPLEKIIRSNWLLGMCIEVLEQIDDVGIQRFWRWLVDPCIGFQCSSGEQCKLDDWRRPSCVCRTLWRPSCVCRTLCSYDYNPVCANDGRSYSNECVMNAEACKNRVRLRVVHNGECTASAAGARHVT